MEFLLDGSRTVLAFQMVQTWRYLRHHHLEATSTTDAFSCVETHHARKDEHTSWLQSYTLRSRIS
jgi:hypothetical protein